MVVELRTPGIEAVGFGVPARIDSRTGIALGAVNTPIHHVAFREVLEERLGMTVGAINDGSAATLAEFTHGAGQDAHDLVLLTLGTGVGGGFVLDGQLYRGWAEVGHMVIVENGEPCQGACTGRGHVESYCSGHAADRLARAAARSDARPRATSSSSATRHSTEIGKHLGAAIASLVNLFDPDMVLIGGGFGVAAGEPAPRAGARGRAARGARTGRRPRASSPWPSSGRLQASSARRSSRSRRWSRGPGCRWRSARRRSGTSPT